MPAGIRFPRRVNWYYNLDRNWELTAPWQGRANPSAVTVHRGLKDSVITGLIGAKRVRRAGRVLPI